MKRKTHIILLATLFLGALGPSCTDEAAAVGELKVEPDATGMPALPAAKARASKVVFVDKQDACECTRARADDSWAALQSALDGRADIAVERIYVDTEPDQVAPYREMRAFMVLPAVYVLDASGTLVDRLQGEITAERFGAALK